MWPDVGGQQHTERRATSPCVCRFTGVMCGRFALSASRYDVVKQFHVDEVVGEGHGPATGGRVRGGAGASSSAESAPPASEERFNVAPSQPVLAVATSKDGTVRRLGTFRWGLVPAWASDPSIGNRMINARSESAPTKPAFRRAFERRRCLLPASGYYEWQDSPGPRRKKAPFYFCRRDGLLLAIGGLWEVWHGDDEVLRTCTVLTTRANALGARVHDRMPVLVPEHLWDRWLAPEPLTDEERAAATAPAPDDLLVALRVSEDVNDPHNEGPHLAEPIEGVEATEDPEIPEVAETAEAAAGSEPMRGAQQLPFSVPEG